MRHSHKKIEYGDFQTPIELSDILCKLLKDKKLDFAGIIEPTCGVGNFLSSAVQIFSQATAIGVEVNPDYAKIARENLRSLAKIYTNDFFTMDWSSIIDSVEGNILVIGNPPWVTNSQVGSISGSNLPDKTNFQKLNGLDAITGKSNFDISEWMMLRIVEWLDQTNGVLAILCKSSVARKILKSSWQNNKKIISAEIYNINTKQYFDAAVDSCFLICEFGSGNLCHEAKVFDLEKPTEYKSILGWRNNQLICNLDYYEKFNYLTAVENENWRSGIKHDASAIMELEIEDGVLMNGYGQIVSIEDDYLFPMLKTSDVANGRLTPRRYMIVPQKKTGQETDNIKIKAPRTWKYLSENSERLNARASSIYRNRPQFSIFGIGDYTFAPWKIAISSMYKHLKFQVVGPYNNKPMVFDDATYFLPCEDQNQAELLGKILNSNISRQFYESFIFWDSKRPITADLLKKLNLEKLCAELGTPIQKTQRRLDL